MNVLPYTLLLLALIALMTGTRLHQIVDRTVSQEALLAQVQAWRGIVNAEEHRLFNGWCAHNLKPGPKAGSKRPPRTNKEHTPKPPTLVATEEEPIYPDSGAEDFLLSERLNLAAIVTGHLRDSFIRLLHQLDPDLDTEAFMEHLLATLQKDGPHLQTTEELATIDLADPAMQKAWYRLLKGKRRVRPPLFTLVQWDPSGETLLKLFRLPPPLLDALTGDRGIAQTIADYRTQLLNAYSQDKHKPSRWENRLRTFVLEKWPQAPWTEHLSYTLSPPDSDAVITASEEEGRPIHHDSRQEPRPFGCVHYLLRE